MKSSIDELLSQTEDNLNSVGDPIESCRHVDRINGYDVDIDNAEGSSGSSPSRAVEEAAYGASAVGTVSLDLEQEEVEIEDNEYIFEFEGEVSIEQREGDNSVNVSVYQTVDLINKYDIHQLDDHETGALLEAAEEAAEFYGEELEYQIEEETDLNVTSVNGQAMI